MGKSASEVRSEIEGTRREMSDAIDAIADRTSPGRVVERRRRRMADGWRSVRERVMGRAQDTYGSATGAAQGVAGSARDTASSVAGTAREAPERLLEQAQGNPVAAGVIAFGGGLLLASLLPPSQAEQRVAGQVVDQAAPLRDELARAGQQVVDEVRTTAQEGAEQVRQRTSEAAENVQGDVRSSAGTVAEQAGQ
ncbi:MAG TPA: DUF3618 domain-containing protein [Acidimicrobiales bacterium]|nr:DUF3618 domain-containing protein [Acidimicrobiales bacterium]